MKIRIIIKLFQLLLTYQVSNYYTMVQHIKPVQQAIHLPQVCTLRPTPQKL